MEMICLNNVIPAILLVYLAKEDKILIVLLAIQMNFMKQLHIYAFNVWQEHILTLLLKTVWIVINLAKLV